jgi:hypothetical protein
MAREVERLGCGHHVSHRHRVLDLALADRGILDPAARAGLPGVRGVAPAAAQIAFAEAHEQGRAADVRALALERGEDLDEICRGHRVLS